MIPFHETLEKFFRKNFYDEIQKLPVEGISDQLSLSGVKNPFSVSSFDAQALSTNLGHKRSNSSAARPSLSLPMPINVPGSTPLLVQNGFGLGQANSANAGPTRRPTQTLLQKNLAHLAQYGLTSLGSTGPERSTTTSDTRSDSPIESLVHVGPVMPSSSAPEGSMMDSVRSKFPRIGSIRSVLRSRSETH